MSKLILVVEDQEDNRRIMRDLLSSAGSTDTRPRVRSRPTQISNIFRSSWSPPTL